VILWWVFDFSPSHWRGFAVLKEQLMVFMPNLRNDYRCMIFAR
jgi:hypothetical protein